MTTEEIAPSEERLRAMLAGCDGVPNGAWTNVDDQVPNIISSGRYWIATTRFPYTSHEQIGRVTGHILNCHPDTIRSLVTELLALREAVKPFAKAADIRLCGDFRDDERFGHIDLTFHLTFGDLRRAARALSHPEPMK